MWFDLKHLKKANLGYFAHAYRVSVISIKLLFIGTVGLLHAILPIILTESVSKGVKKINVEIGKF